MNRKVWSNEEKVAIVLEILRGGESAAAVCTRYRVSATQVYRWLDRFLEGGRRGTPGSVDTAGYPRQQGCW